MSDDAINNIANTAGNNTVLELATELTIAWLSNPNTRVRPDDIPGVLTTMHSALSGLTSSQSAANTERTEEFTPAVTVRKSLASTDHIISMIDGKAYKALKRHLTSNGLTPAQYRERFNLKADYPMVSETYSQVRRDMAKKIGLGRKPGEKVNTRKSATAKPAADKPATAKTAAVKSAAAKSAPRKKLGVQFSAIDAAPGAQG